MQEHKSMPDAPIRSDVLSAQTGTGRVLPGNGLIYPITVAFLKSGRVARWDDRSGSLLEFAEKLGLTLSYCCRAGVCNTCVGKLVRGAVNYILSPICEPAQGEILLCCSRPTESVDIDI